MGTRAKLRAGTKAPGMADCSAGNRGNYSVLQQAQYSDRTTDRGLEAMMVDKWEKIGSPLRLTDAAGGAEIR